MSIQLRLSAVLLLLSSRALAVEAWHQPEQAAQLKARTAPSPTQKLLRENKRADLETLYKSRGPGPMPDGACAGTGTVSPGRGAGRISEAFFSVLWQGKIFDRANGTLINNVTGGHAFKAKVFFGESWIDGKPSIIIDYEETSTLAGFLRDEIREVAPGLYLGFAFERTSDGTPATAKIVFALNFNR